MCSEVSLPDQSNLQIRGFNPLLWTGAAWLGPRISLGSSSCSIIFSPWTQHISCSLYFTISFSRALADICHFTLKRLSQIQKCLVRTCQLQNMIYLTMFKNIASIFMGKKRFYYRVCVLIWNLKALYFIEFSSFSEEN